MFQLYKKRNFNELVGDTFSFFKLYGKHYFRNYLIVNGGFVLILLVLAFFLFKIFYEGTLSGLSNGGPGNQFDSFIAENFLLFMSFGGLSVLLLVIISLISYLYPVVYLDLLSRKKDFDTAEITQAVKSKIGKVLLFFILSMFTAMPLIAIAFMLSFALVFILIGIPLILLLIPAAGSWLSLSFYNYISTDDDYFASLSKAFQMMKSKFWPIIGSTFVMYLIVQAIVGTISMVPYIIGVASVFTTLENPDAINPDSSSPFSFFVIMMLLVFVLSVVLNFFMQNLLLINNGVIYYSIREESENNTPKNDIDLIGTQSE
ncbi:hypothetical protein [Flavobacterium sp. WV_118_3]|uniref:hypothetical protein n=1 Tax=Flavobacterium sp. WV_118_3 TaxID=3151764 RepID=UPI00321AE582